MVTVFITASVFSLVIISIAGIGIYYWQKSRTHDAERIVPPNPDFYGLFAEKSADNRDTAEADAERRLVANDLVLQRARSGELAALSEAKSSADDEFYDRVLSVLVEQSGAAARLLSLMSYVAQHELPVNRALASAVVAAWRKSPDRSSASKALHFAALSDDADLFRQTIEDALRFRREGKLTGISELELRALFDGEFWILSAHTRSSGAGFVLKRTLDNARRELETASVKQ